MLEFTFPPQKKIFRTLNIFSKCNSLKKKREKKKKETGNGDAHTLRRGIPGPKPHFLPCKVTETSLLYLKSGSCATQSEELSQNLVRGWRKNSISSFLEKHGHTWILYLLFKCEKEARTILHSCLWCQVSPAHPPPQADSAWPVSPQFSSSKAAWWAMSLCFAFRPNPVPSLTLLRCCV